MQCSGCTSEDCKECDNCLDKPKYGGEGLKNRRYESKERFSLVSKNVLSMGDCITVEGLEEGGIMKVLDQGKGGVYKLEKKYGKWTKVNLKKKWARAEEEEQVNMVMILRTRWKDREVIRNRKS